MFGFQTTASSETQAVVLQLISVLADPEAGKVFLTSINDRIAEFTKMRDDLTATQAVVEQQVSDANAALAEAKRLGALLNADRVSLDKITADLQGRDAAVTARENSLNDTAEKIKTDFKSQQAKLDTDRIAFEQQKGVDLKAFQDSKNNFEMKVVTANADISKRLSDATDLKNQAVQFLSDASVLKAKWEAKIKAITAMAQSVTES